MRPARSGRGPISLALLSVLALGLLAFGVRRRILGSGPRYLVTGQTRLFNQAPAPGVSVLFLPMTKRVAAIGEVLQAMALSWDWLRSSGVARDDLSAGRYEDGGSQNSATGETVRT